MFWNMSQSEKSAIKRGVLQTLSPEEWVVCIAIMGFANEDMKTHVSLVTLSDATGLGMEELEDAVVGLIYEKIFTATSETNTPSWFNKITFTPNF